VPRVGGLGDDGVGILGPREGPAAVVPGGDEALDGADEVSDGGEVVATQRLAADRKEGLDQVEMSLPTVGLRGDLLPDWYDDWVLLERGRLRPGAGERSGRGGGPARAARPRSALVPERRAGLAARRPMAHSDGTFDMPQLVSFALAP
jgi:hypothetical protein